MAPRVMTTDSLARDLGVRARLGAIAILAFARHKEYPLSITTDKSQTKHKRDRYPAVTIRPPDAVTGNKPNTAPPAETVTAGEAENLMDLLN